MTLPTEFDIGFAALPVELQREALREGELRIAAQFQAATAADQRALTWGGFLITSATAALGGGVALLTKTPPTLWLGYLAITFAFFMLRASWLAVSTVSPDLFCFPGNRPGKWIRDNADSNGVEQALSQRDRCHQARFLDGMIIENAASAAVLAKKMHKSFALALATVTIAGALLLLGLIATHLSVREPTSEIIQRLDSAEA
jgi:hypothetical protein